MILSLSVLSLIRLLTSLCLVTYHIRYRTASPGFHKFVVKKSWVEIQSPLVNSVWYDWMFLGVDTPTMQSYNPFCG